MVLRFLTFGWFLFWGSLLAALTASGNAPVEAFFLATALGTTMALGFAHGKGRREMENVYLVRVYCKAALANMTAEELRTEMAEGDPSLVFSDIWSAKWWAEDRALQEGFPEPLEWDYYGNGNCELVSSDDEKDSYLVLEVPLRRGNTCPSGT